MLSKKALLLTILLTALSIAYLCYLSQRVQVPVQDMKIFKFSGDSVKYRPDDDSGYAANISNLNLSMDNQDKEYSYKALSTYWSEQKIDFSMLTTSRLPNQFELPMESEILSDKPLEDITSVVSPDKSLIKVLEDPDAIHRQENKMMVLLDLRDELGRKVSKGGHQVRVWLTDKQRGLSATLHVTDLHNGIYIALFPLLWNGNTTVNAALVRPREFLQMTLRQHQRLKVTRPMVANFLYGNISQATLCMPFPMIQGYRNVCNLTAVNSGLPWYCGKPTHPNLSCSDWVHSRSLYQCSVVYPVTKAEEEVVKKFPPSAYIFPLKGLVKLTREGNLTAANNISCYKREPRATWTDQSPRGYWEKEVWHHLMCSVPKKTESFFAQCFPNTTFLMLGDSNAESIYTSLLGFSKCKPIQENYVLHKSLICNNDQMGLHIAWHPHAYPFHSGKVGWASQSPLKHPPSYYMDQIPAVGKFVVLIHLYAHFNYAITHAYIPHVRDAVRATRDLVQRNPSAKVVFKGPHVYQYPAGDYTATRLFPILKEEFKSLQDSVVFLDGWDMTVAVENIDMHPPRYIVDAMTMVLLGHVCPP